MGDSETFGVEAGSGEAVVGWINEQARRGGMRLEARLYGGTLETGSFGSFEMFSWVGDARAARRLVVRASKRFRVRVIEGGYKTREATFRLRRGDFGMVRRGDRLIGRLELEAPRLGRGGWRVRAEERC